MALFDGPLPARVIGTLTMLLNLNGDVEACDDALTRMGSEAAVGLLDDVEVAEAANPARCNFTRPPCLHAASKTLLHST